MSRNINITVLSVFISMAAVFAGLGSLFADDVEVERIEINPTGISEFVEVHDSLEFGNGGFILFARARHPDFSQFIASLQVDAEGNPSNPVSLFECPGIVVTDCSAVMLDDSAVSTGGAKSKTVGLVYLARYLPNLSNDLIVSVGKIDNKGSLIGSFSQLMRIKNVNATNQFKKVKIVAVKRDDAIGVAVSAVNEQNYSTFRSFAYFLETDTNGTLLRGPRAVKLTNRGNKQCSQVGKPIWTGSNWLVPARNVDERAAATGVSVTGDITYPHSLNVIYVKPKGSKLRTKFREIDNDKQPTKTFIYNGGQFLPKAASISPPAAFHNLLSQRRDYSPEGEKDPLTYHCDYRYWKIKNNGKKKGKEGEIPIGEWQPTLERRPDDDFSVSRENISNAALMADGRYLLILTRNLRIRRAATAPEEGALDFESYMAALAFQIGKFNEDRKYLQENKVNNFGSGLNLLYIWRDDKAAVFSPQYLKNATSVLLFMMILRNLKNL